VQRNSLQYQAIPELINGIEIDDKRASFIEHRIFLNALNMQLWKRKCTPASTNSLAMHLKNLSWVIGKANNTFCAATRECSFVYLQSLCGITMCNQRVITRTKHRCWKSGWLALKNL